MAWALLLLAAVFEVGWAIGLKLSDGFTRPGPTGWTVLSLVLSMVLLGAAARSLPIGTAYAVWTGLGAAGTAALGMLWLGEPVTAARIASLALIIAGVAGLKLSS